MQEIKQQIAELTSEDQVQLAAYQRAMRTARAPGFQERVAAAHRRMDSGEAVSSAALRAMLAADPTVTS